MENINETIEESKINISVQLEYIGTYATKLLYSREAQANKNLFNRFTIILMKAFKLYISTPYLEGYLLNEPPKFNKSEKRYYSNFVGYKKDLIRLISFINGLDDFEELTTKQTNFELQTATGILKDSSALLEYRLDKLFEIEIAKKMEFLNND